jgi:hypothetical protein
MPIEFYYSQCKPQFLTVNHGVENIHLGLFFVTLFTVNFIFH